jgi:hypothetical protein
MPFYFLTLVKVPISNLAGLQTVICHDPSVQHCHLVVQISSSTKFSVDSSS